jgi:hypothetical protein
VPVFKPGVQALSSANTGNAVTGCHATSVVHPRGAWDAVFPKIGA